MMFLSPRALGLLFLLALLGCVHPRQAKQEVPFHVVMGSNSYGYPGSQIQLVNSIQGDLFQARHSRLQYPECASGALDVMEFSGTINSTSLSSLNSIMQSIQPCIRRDGSRVVSPVYLNSAQGDLLLGIQLGKWFQTQAVEVIVSEGQVCESACAVAYLGAVYKRVQATGRVVLYLSGEYGRGFDCARSVDMMPLKNYLLSTNSSQSGKSLYNQALTHCRNRKGWDLS
ncbi:MAG: hypothetical protein EXR37_06445 [Limnohabitans sp.]|nr:hypothetical protein [Limnohabitans sp.]